MTTKTKPAAKKAPAKKTTAKPATKAPAKAKKSVPVTVAEPVTPQTTEVATTTPPNFSLFDGASVGSVKAAIKEAGGSSGDLWMVPYGQLRVADGFNVRVHDAEYEKHLEWLTGQMVERGYDRTRPMAGYVVKEGEHNVFYITDGHSRFIAAGRAIDAGAPIERIPMIVAPAGTSVEDLTVALVTSNAGRPLTPYEIAVVCKRLQGYGLDDKEIAKRLGFTSAYVKQLFDLLAAPKVVRDMVAEGKVSASLAVQTVRKMGGKEAASKLKEGLRVAEKTGKGKVTAKTVKKITKAAEAPIDADKAEMVALIREMHDYILQVRVGTDAQELIDRAERLVMRRKADHQQPELPLEPATADEEDAL